MTGFPPERWLFTRGTHSVRVVREEDSKVCRLFLYGPDTDVVTHEFADITECMKRQAEIERTLLAEGYQLAQLSADRRGEHGTCSGPDHRRGGELIISTSEVEHSMSGTLFWSKRGDVACESHAPQSDSERWRAEGWCSIPASANGRHGLMYQCPHCAADGRSHRHIRETEDDADEHVRSA
jgi:hypothetical protein